MFPNGITHQKQRPKEQDPSTTKRIGNSLTRIASLGNKKDWRDKCHQHLRSKGQGHR